MIAVLCANLLDGDRFAAEKNLGSSLLISPRNCDTARGQTLTAAYETPAFRAAVSDASQCRVRKVVAPALYTTGGEFIPPKE
jgi:hypothetical protein